MNAKKENKQEKSEVREPVVAYQRSVNLQSAHVMPIEEALENGMLLEESRNMMRDKIQRDFPDYRF